MQSPTSNEHSGVSPSPVGKCPPIAVVLLWTLAGSGTMLVIFILILGIPVQSKTFYGGNFIYCCPDVASQLIKAANFTLNPCDNYFMYTCYNWQAVHNKSTDILPFLTLFVSVTTGYSRSPVGKAISRFYQSCVMTLGQEVDIPTKVMSALVESTGASKDMTPTDTLRVLMQLSLLHNLYTPVSVNIRLRLGGTMSALLLRSKRRPSSKAWRFWKGKEPLLNTFNHMLRVTVEKKELLRLENRTTSRAPSYGLQASNTSLLENVVPNVSQYQWMDIMTSFYVGQSPMLLLHTDIEVIRQDLFALTADRGERREAQLAFLLVGASIDMLDDFFYSELSGKWATLFQYCESMTITIVSFWRILMKELTDPMKDDVVDFIFRAIKDAVTADALNLLDPADSGKARDLLSAMHLVRARDLVPHNITLPVMGEGLYSDILRAQRFDVTVGKSLEAQGGVLYPGLNEHVISYPFRQNNALVVPALSYGFLRFGNDTDPAINMAVIGVKFSEIFWSSVLHFENWTMESKSRIEKMVTCLRLSVAVNHRSWTFRHLSVKSAVRAASAFGLEWHRLLEVWMLNSLSRAQMFYMKYVTSFCNQKNFYYRERIQDLLSSFRDFRDAYACVSPVNSAQCYLDL